MKRTVIKVDEQTCNGCGNCVTGCHEGALQMINGTGSSGGRTYKEYWTLQQYTSGAAKPVHLNFTGDRVTFDDYIDGGAFEQALNTAVEAFFAVEPFPTYRNYFTITAVAAHSEQKGATVQEDFRNNGPKAQTKKTVFNSVLQGANSTNISCSYDKVLDYAKLIPGLRSWNTLRLFH